MKVLFRAIKIRVENLFRANFNKQHGVFSRYFADRSLEKPEEPRSLIKRGARVNAAPLIAIPRCESEFDRVALSTNGSVGLVEAANGRTMEFRKNRA